MCPLFIDSFPSFSLFFAFLVDHLFFCQMLFSPLVLNTFLLVSLLLLQQAHGLRVAVLLSGEFRTWLVTRHTYYEYLLKYNRERGHEMDVFVSTYDKTLPSDTEVTEYAKRCHEVCNTVFFRSWKRVEDLPFDP